MTQGDDLIPTVVLKKGIKKNEEVTFGNFEKNESFDATSLPDYWITLRSAAKDLYSLSEKPGYLSLKCVDISATERNTPAFVCRRMQHHNFVSTTKLIFDPVTENDAAGVLLYKDERHQYFLCVKKSGSGRKVMVEKISKDGVETLGEEEIEGGVPVQLKVVSKGKSYDFYYATGNSDQWKMVSGNVDAHYLSTDNSFGFTGTTIGMYATSKE